MQISTKASDNGIIITKEVIRKKTNTEKLLNQYKKIKKIGESPFAKIKLVVDVNTGKQYAMKKFNMFILRKKVKMSAKSGGETKYSSQADGVLNQIQIMKKLSHPNIVKLHEIIYDEEEEKIYLIMDYCKYGDIAQWNHKIQLFSCQWSPKQIAKFYKEATLGLQNMHSLNIIHRDIKPQNILITAEKTAKLIDFGRSVLLTHQKQTLTGSEGTYHFMAPETLSQKIKGGFDGRKSDIWALGVSLYSTIFLQIPFNDEHLVNLFSKIQSGSFSFPINMTQHQQKFVPLIKQMLNLDWNKRPLTNQIIKRLQNIQTSL